MTIPNELFLQNTAIFKALANENRLRIFHLLCFKPLCVCELTFILNISQATVSRHLLQLKNAGLIRDEKVIPWTQYRVNSSLQNPLGKWLIRHAKEWSEKDEQLQSDLMKARTVDRRTLSPKEGSYED